MERRKGGCLDEKKGHAQNKRCQYPCLCLSAAQSHAQQKSAGRQNRKQQLNQQGEQVHLSGQIVP